MQEGKTKVLVVEDNATEVPLYERCLGAEYDVTAVHEVDKAIALLRERRFDLCIADYVLQTQNAEVLLKKAGSYLYGTPVIVVTGIDTPEIDARVMSLGAADYIPKNEMLPPLVQRCARHVLVREQANKALRKRIREDSLTGASTRSYFIDYITLELSRYKRHGSVACLVMLDVHELEQVNRTYGLLAGDELLKRVAAMLKVGLRTLDIVGRIAGGKFGILMPETDIVGAEVVVNRIIKRLAGHYAHWQKVEIPLTVTAGVSQVSSRISEVEQWLYLAEKAMREATENNPGAASYVDPRIVPPNDLPVIGEPHLFAAVAN